MKSGSGLAALRPFLAGRLPSGALPTSCFLATFAGGFAPAPRPVAFIAFAGFDFGLGTLPPISSQGPPDIIGFNDDDHLQNGFEVRRAKFGFRGNAFTPNFTYNLRWGRHVNRAIHVLQTRAPLRGADVVLLQEMDADGTERIANALEMFWVYYPAAIHPKRGRDFGNAILSRWPIVAEELGVSREPYGLRMDPTHLLTAEFHTLTLTHARGRSDAYVCSYQLVDLRSGRMVWEDKWEVKRAIQGLTFD